MALIRPMQHGMAFSCMSMRHVARYMTSKRGMRVVGREEDRGCSSCVQGLVSGKAERDDSEGAVGAHEPQDDVCTQGPAHVAIGHGRLQAVAKGRGWRVWERWGEGLGAEGASGEGDLQGSSMTVHGPDMTDAAWCGLRLHEHAACRSVHDQQRGDMRSEGEGRSEDSRAVCRYLLQTKLSGPIPKELSALTSLQFLYALTSQCMWR